MKTHQIFSLYCSNKYNVEPVVLLKIACHLILQETPATQGWYEISKCAETERDTISSC